MFFSKQKSYLGIDLGAGGVKLVELKEEKNRPVLHTYGLASETQDVHRLVVKKPIEEEAAVEQTNGVQVEKKSAPRLLEDEERLNGYAGRLKAVCRAARTMAKSASVSLPVSAVFHAIVTLPKVEKGEFSAVLKAEAQKLLPYPLDEMILDYQILAGLSDEKNQKIMVNAVPKSVVAFYTEVFRRAGLALDSLEPESTALERSLIGRDTAVTMLIDMGAERTNFFIIDGAVPITHHTIESGGNKINRLLRDVLGLEEAAIERAKLDLFDSVSRPPVGGNGRLDKAGFIKLLTPVIDPVAKQIEYSFDLYLNQSGNESKRPEKIVLTGGAAVMPFLTEYLSEIFKVKCYIGDPWARVVHQEKLRPILNNIGPRLSVAIGLALRRFA